MSDIKISVKVEKPRLNRINQQVRFAVNDVALAHVSLSPTIMQNSRVVCRPKMHDEETKCYTMD